MTMRESRPARVRKIAVLRANALGDYIFCLPALTALKRAWPQAELVYLGRQWHRDFLAGRPGPVDRVEVVPKCHGIPHEDDREENAGEIEAFFSAMRDEKFDLAFQMHGGGGNSNPFVRRLGARLTLGFKAQDAPPLDRNIAYSLYQNEVLRYLEVAELAGADTGPLQPQLPVTTRDHQELGAALPGLRRPFAVLHPGASDPRRRWPAKKVARVADALTAHGLHVYLSGIPEEQSVVQAVLDHATSKPESLCGRLTLNALTALLSQAEIVVSNDTGPLHLARAVGANTIGTYWVGNVINAGPVAAAGNRICMSWTAHCPECGMDCIANDAHVARGGCDHAVSFLDAISFESVWSEVESLLDKPVGMRQLAAV